MGAEWKRSRPVPPRNQVSISDLGAGLECIEPGWFQGMKVVALDGQGGIEQAHKLQYSLARPWVKEELQENIRNKSRE